MGRLVAKRRCAGAFEIGKMRGNKSEERGFLPAFFKGKCAANGFLEMRGDCLAISR